MIPSSPNPRRPKLPWPCLLLLPSLALTLPACGGSTSSVSGSDSGTDGGGTAEGGGESAQEAASAAASAYCGRASACAAVFVTDGFGTMANCQSHLQTQLLADLSAPGSSTTVAQLEACTTALPQASCADLLGNVTIPACKTMPGTFAAGAACGTDSQCATTHCTIPTTAVCGTCTTQAAVGGACGVDSDCQSGMKCLNGACATYVLQGGACSATQPCRPDLGCVNGTCGTPSPAGTACKTSAECDQLSGDFCNPASLVCQTITFAQPGSACGLVSGQLVLCAGPGGYCKGDNVAPYVGTCEAHAMSGASCDTDAGPLCDYGSTCVSGTCTTSDPASCK